MRRCEANTNCNRPVVGLVVLHTDLDGFRPDFFKGDAIKVCSECRPQVQHPHGGGVTFVACNFDRPRTNAEGRREFERLALELQGNQRQEDANQ